MSTTPPEALPATTNAAYVTALGPADKIRVGPLPTPVPGPFDVLVRTRALAVNHVDTFIRSGAYPTSLRFPFVIGRDLVGVIETTGDAVDGYAPGEQVWCNSLGFDGRQGSFAEHVVVPRDRLYRLPAGVDPVDAVAVVHTAATAYLGLFRHARLGFGETIFVSGAGGGVGSAVVQLAATAGARVIATTRGEDADWCRDCGARMVFDYRDPDLADKLTRAAPGGVNVYWQTSSRYDLNRVLPLLAPGARVVVMAGLNARPTLPIGQLYTRDASLLGFAITNATAAELAEAARAINHGLTSRILRSRVATVLPLSHAAEAHQHQESGRPGGSGRIVVIP